MPPPDPTPEQPPASLDPLPAETAVAGSPGQTGPESPGPGATAPEAEDSEWEDVEEIEPGPEGPAGGTETKLTRVRRRRPRARPDSPELRLRGRRALCKRIEDIAPNMLKTVKLRILTNYLPS